MALLADLRQRWFARFYDRVSAIHEREVSTRKQALFADLRGTVLELGPGTGVNLQYLPRGVRWLGAEPNPHMHPLLLERAARLGVRAELCPTDGAQVEVDTGTVDVVVATLVLCSVDDPARVLADVRRVLRPGGRLLFLEHVGAPPGTVLRAFQRTICPLWRCLADGCRTDRDTGDVLRAAGFARLELEEFRLPLRRAWPVAPHVLGVATN